MTRPVLPPTFPRELEIAGPALLRVEEVEAVTLDRPCDALEEACEAPSFAFVAPEAAALAASEVVEAVRDWEGRRENRKGLNTARAAVEGMINGHRQRQRYSDDLLNFEEDAKKDREEWRIVEKFVRL